MGLDGLPVLERGAEKREYPGGVESISSAGVVELRIHVSVSAMMSGLYIMHTYSSCNHLPEGSSDFY